MGSRSRRRPTTCCHRTFRPSTSSADHMCGRYASARSVQDLAVAFGIRDDHVELMLAADWNVAPTKAISAVLHPGGGPGVTPVPGGLVPAVAGHPPIRFPLIHPP